MDKKVGIQKIEALPAGAQRFSHGMRSIGQLWGIVGAILTFWVTSAVMRLIG